MGSGHSRAMTGIGITLRRFGRVSMAAAVLVMAGVLASSARSASAAPSTELVSVLGADNYNSHGAQPSISADGRYVAFTSGSVALVPGDTNGLRDVFVKDRQTGVIDRVSVSSSGGEANAHCSDPSISADGRFVAFETDASNLVLGDTNGQHDVFVHDRVTGITERVSVDSSGAEATGFSSEAAINSDGRFVAFRSSASNLVPVDANGADDVFIHDRMTGTTELVSVSSTETQGNSRSYYPAINGDGRFVAFSFDGNDLVPIDTNGSTDVFVRDCQSGTTERVSVTSSGGQGDGAIFDAISADGRYVAFVGGANLVSGDINGVSDVFVHDRVTGTTERVSVDSSGGEGNGAVFVSFVHPVAISADGNVVSFTSRASNLVVGDTNGAPDVFIHNRITDITERVSVSTTGGDPNGESWHPAVSATGRYVAFTSGANNLVPSDINGGEDVFVRDVTGNEPPAVTCSGPIALWPPNHHLVDVSSVFAVEDTDGDDVTLAFTVLSDETEVPAKGDGSGNHAPDFKNEFFDGGRGLLVRSERRGTGNGRFYLLIVTADDSNGGITSRVCGAAVVPHDQNPGSLAQVLAESATAAAQVQTAIDNAMPFPPGLYQHGLSGQLGPFQ